MPYLPQLNNCEVKINVMDIMCRKGKKTFASIEIKRILSVHCK